MSLTWGDAFPPGNAAQDLATARIGHENTGEDLDGGGLARAVGTDVADKLSRLNRE